MNPNFGELAKHEPSAEPNGGLTREETTAMDEAYAAFEAQMHAYAECLRLEDDPHRKQVLRGLMDSLAEDNK